MKKKCIVRSGAVIVMFLVTVCGIWGQNPIIEHMYTADPAAIVHNDTVFLYTGHDEAGENAGFYNMNDWQLFTSTDMVNWTSEGAVLHVDDFSWAIRDAWASEVEERNGKFYFYICAEHNNTDVGKAIGVAVSDSPYGPFEDAIGGPLVTNSMTTAIESTWDDIDPTVFIDDDDQAYMFWGNTQCYYVKLKDNMIELDGEIQTVDLPSFTEAPYMTKYNDTYYLSYAYGWPEQIAYATSSSIEGPWTFQGVINDHIENSGTNHQSIIDFKDQWYFIYHTADLPGGGDYRRSVAIEYLFYNEDGTMKEIVQTPYGVAHADSTSACPPVPVDSNIQINGGDWEINRKHELIEGDDVVISPETAEEGSWEWSGPGDFTETSQEIVFNDLTTEQSGLYMTVFTNNCGTKSYMSFTLNINPDVPENIASGEAYVIRPLNSELAVSLQNGQTSNGTAIIQTTFDNTSGQQWRLTNVEGIYWRISPMSVISRGMDVDAFSQDDGAKVQIWDYWGGETQQWQIIEPEPGVYTFKARHSDKCLQTTGTPTSNGALLQQYACNGNQNQQFTLTLAKDEETPTRILNEKESTQHIKIHQDQSLGRQVHVDLSQVIDPVNMTIYDINGKIIYNEPVVLQSKLIQPGIAFDQGIYLVSVQTGNTLRNVKFVKE